jgi:hypothetical protein
MFSSPMIQGCIRSVIHTSVPVQIPAGGSSGKAADLLFAISGTISHSGHLFTFLTGIDAIFFGIWVKIYDNI